MSIWSKVLIGLIAVAALVFFYLAVRTLKTHAAWHGLVPMYESRIGQEEARTPTLINGNENTPGLRQLRTELHGQLVDRGRVWNDATPGQVDAQTGAVTVTFAVPPVTPLDDKAVLYLFDQAEVAGGGSYLGQFKVVGIGDTGVALESTTKLTQRALDRLAAAQGPWSLCEVLPADSHEIFAGLPPADIEALLPESTREEYLNDGQPAGPNAPPAQVVNGNFVRPLRDYDVIFREDARLRTIEIDKINAAKKDLQYMTAAHADALKQEQHVRDLITSLETELARYTRERDAIVAHENQVAARLATVQEGIDRLFVENKRLAAELAELQTGPAPPSGEAVSRP